MLFWGFDGFKRFNSDSNSEPSVKTEIMESKFVSMKACLRSLKKESGHSLKIYTDEPTLVSGSLGTTDLVFRCELKETGSEGTYILGWYERPVTKN
ncbi:hypothetical protein JK152_11775 [Acinetobacter nectaris]|nr:hypothetical protein [Acinetobacter nectaris]MCF9035498.1 hypothetical protein [Acinetobacter nectaris]